MILQELKRIANKGVIIMLVVLLALNALLYISEQEQYGGELMSTYAGKTGRGELFSDIEQYDKISALNKIYKQNYENIEGYYAYDHEHEEDLYTTVNIRKVNAELETSGDVEQYVYNYIAHRLLSDQVGRDEKEGNYHERIDDVLTRAIQLSSVSIYKKEGTFSYYNVRKTAYDFKPLLTVETKYVSERPYDSLFEYDWLSYLLAIFGLVVAFRAIQEKTNGMEQLIYSAERGREKLAVARVISVFIIMLAATIIFYLETMLICKLVYGNIGFWDAPIQCNKLFEHTCLLLNRAEFLGLSIVAQAVGICIIAALLIMMFSIIRDTGICVMGVSALVAVEGILIRTLKGDSVWMIFRYVNIFTLINPESVLIDYHNFGVAGFITDRMRTGATMAAVSFVVILVGYMFVMWKFHPQRKQSIIARMLERIAEYVRKVTCRTPVWVKQIYKVLISQRMIIVMIILFIFAWEWQTKVKITYSDEHSMVHQYYEECGGDSSDKGIEYLNGLKAKIDELDAKLAELRAIKVPNKVELSYIDMHESDKVVYEKAVAIISEEMEYQQSLEEKGINAVTVPQYSYDAFFGKQSSKVQERYTLLAVLFAIVVSFGAFSYEKKTHSDVLLRSAANRRGFLIAQQISIVVMNLVGAAVIYGINYANLNKLYELDYKDASILNVEMFREFPINISIGTVIMIIYVYRLFIMVAVSELVVLLSYHTDYYKTLAVALMLVIPYALEYVGIDVLNVFSVVRYMSLNKLILSYGVSVETIVGGVCYIMAGAMSVVVFRRKWEGCAVK